MPASENNGTLGNVGLKANRKDIKPQQLIAGMAFRLLGLDFKQIYKTNHPFLTGIDDNIRQFAGFGYNAQANTIAETAQLLRVFVQNNDVVEHGTIERNKAADYFCELGEGENGGEVIAFSKTYHGKQITVVYNASQVDATEKFILLGTQANANTKSLSTVYGYDTCGQLHLFHGKLGNKAMAYIKMYLKPMHLVILKNY